jgi:hypothetical protein
MRRRAITAISLLALFLASHEAGAQVQYRLSGSAEHWKHQPWSTNVLQHEAFQFEVLVRDEKWRINAWRSDITNAGTMYSVGSETGEEVAHLVLPEGPESFLFVEPGAFPTGQHMPVIVHLWMAYASAAYFATNTSAFLPPIDRYAYDRQVPRQTDILRDEAVRLQLNEDAPKLPRYLALYVNGLQNAPGRAESRWPPPFQNGYTNSIYEASDYRAVGKLQIPWHIRFESYLPQSKGTSSNDLTVLYACEITLEAASDECPAYPLRLQLPSQFVATDLRMDDGPTNYLGNLRGKMRMSRNVSYNSGDFSAVPTLAELRKYQATPRDVWRSHWDWKLPGALAVLLVVPLIARLVWSSWIRARKAE